LHDFLACLIATDSCLLQCMVLLTLAIAKSACSANVTFTVSGMRG
jgi:hypothetical protein